jgi:hypothetical protein
MIRSKTCLGFLVLAACSAPRSTPSAEVRLRPRSLDALAHSGSTPARLREAQLTQNGSQPRLEIGYHAGVWLGDGEPANDIPIPASLYGRYRLGEEWWVRLGLEFATGDFETPHEQLGLEQDPDEPDIDSSVNYATLLAWLERVWVWKEENEWFVQAGAGFSLVEVDDVQGPLLGGGSFDIETDPGTEILGSVGVGYRRHFGRWRAELLARYDYHAAEWELEDALSGATGNVDDYATWAFLLGIGYSF